MSGKVLRRLKVFGQVQAGQLGLVDAALPSSYRQTERLWRLHRQHVRRVRSTATPNVAPPKREHFNRGKRRDILKEV